MEFATISGTDIKASRIGLGTWGMGGWMWGGTEEQESIRTIRAALDSGINLIDTAPVYGFGRSEEIVGRAIAELGKRDQDVLPYARQNQISTLTYGSLCRGLLSGRMKPDTRFTGDDLRQVDPKFQPPRYAQYLRAVERLYELAQKHYGKRVIDLAVRWVLDQPGVTVALWGARHPGQLAAVDRVTRWKLDPGAIQSIEEIIRETVTDPVGPEFMAPPARQERVPA